MTLDRRQRRAVAALARFLLLHDRDEDASVLFAALARAAADDPYGWYGLGLLAERASEIEAALEYFRRASQVSDDSRYALSFAECLVRAGRGEQALEPLRRAAGASQAEVRDRALAILRRLGAPPQRGT